MSEQNIVNVMVIPDVPKVLPGEQLYVYVPKASFTFPGIIAYNNTQFRIDGNFLFIREDYVSPGVQQKIDGLKQYTDDKLQLKQDKEDNNISLAQRPEQKSVVGAINDLGTLTKEAKNAADHAQSTADNATTLANTGISKADHAQSTADNAQQDAETAQATADNATTLANTGISKADQAQTTANTAVDKANDAKATAQEAIMKADGRSNSIGFMTAKDAVTALNGYPRTQLKGGDTIWIVETGTPDLWVTEVAQESVPYNYTTKDKFNQDLVDNKVLQIGYFKTAYQESDGKPVTIAWQNVLVKSTDWVASTEFADFPYEAKIELTDFVDYTTVPQVVFDIADTISGNYAPICKSGDKCVYIYGKVQDEITLKTVITFAPNVNGASVTGGGYNNRGKWVASTTYEIDDLVYTDNGQYVCIEGITSTTSPEQDTTHWQATFVATGKTKNVLTFSGQDNGTGVQKTFDGSTAVEVSFDETTMTAKEVNGVLKVGAKGTIPEALPQEASALKNGKLPTSGWDTTPKTLYDGPITYGRYGSGGRIYENFLPPFEYSAHTALSDWQGTQLSGNSISNVSALEGGVKLAVRRSDGNDNYVLRIYNTGTVNAWTYNDRDTNGTAQIKVTFLSNWLYTISDTSITANSDVLMELTDEGGVKSYSMEAGKITVFRNTLPTQSIPYTYKVKQTNASGQFTLVNHYVPSIPESPTSLPVSYKKVSGELPTSGWISLDEGWKQNTLPANTDWKSVTYGDGKYVAVTFYSDKGAYSTDGVTWTEMSMPAVDSWIVTYGNGKYVALASGNTKGAYSTNGINWTEMNMPASRSWNGLTYGNGKFVAVAASSDKGAYSTDGVTWTEMSMPTSRDWASVTYGDGKFVAVVVDSLYGAYSADGISWTEMSMPASRIWRRVAYGNGKFVAVGSGSDKGAYSTDGISWTEMSMPTSRSWIGLTYGDDKFVAVAYNSDKGAYSTDGITWTETTLPASIGWNDVTYGDGEFVAVSQSSANGAYWKAAAQVTYSISDTDITANTSVKMYLTDEGGVKAQSKASGSITVIRDSVPTSAIPYEYEVEQTSTPGGFDVINSYMPTVPTKTSQLQNDSNFATTADIPAKTSELENDSGYVRSVPPVVQDVVCNDVDSAATLDTTITCEIGDLILAQIIVRSALTLPTDWTLLRTIPAVETKFNQTLSFAYKRATSTSETLTVTQATAGRIYTNLVRLSNAASISYIQSCENTGTNIASISSTKPVTPNMVIWGASNTMWNNPSPYGDWTYAPSTLDYYSLPQTTRAPRLGTFIDSSGAGERTFTPSISDANGNAMMCGAVEVVGDEVARKGDIPTKTSQLTNDSGFITSSDIPTIPTKTSQLENDSNFAKTNTPNSWGSTQTFTAYDGIKTNRICNAAGTSLVDGTGTTNKFGNGNMPTIIKTSEARPKAEVPYADGTVTRQIALLEDIPSMVIDWVGPSATEQVITGTGMRQIFAEFTDTVGDVSTLYKFYGEIYVDGQNEVNGTSSTVYSTNTDGTELHVITVTPTIRRNTNNEFVLRAECCRYTIGASPMSINKSYLSFVFRKRLY